MGTIRYFVILILAFNWNATASSALYHPHGIDNVNTMKSHPLNRLRHHNRNYHHHSHSYSHHHNHHHNQTENFNHLERINQFTSKKLHKNNNDSHETFNSSLTVATSQKENDYRSSMQRNIKIDGIRTINRTTSTSRRPFNTHYSSNNHFYNHQQQQQHHHHHHHKKQHPPEAIKSSTIISPQFFWTTKSPFQNITELKILKKLSTSTISPFPLKKVSATTSRFHENFDHQQDAKRMRKNFTEKSKNDNKRIDFEDYYYYDEEDGDDDDEDDEDSIDDDIDNDDDGNINNRIDNDAGNDEEENFLNEQRLEKTRKNRGTAVNNFVNNFMDDDYQFDEPINRISTEKSQSLTEQKWREYGTPEAVENSRRKILTETQLVSAHIARIHFEAMCKHPKPKIIQINEASKRYVPHCTVLYRCGDDTGCCHSDTHKCAAKKTTTVDLYFYAIAVGMKEPIVEVLSFVNHTECHCVERSKSSRLVRSHSSLLSSSNHNNYHHHSNGTSKKISSEFCHCTRHYDIFENSILEDQENKKMQKCRCDCRAHNSVCQSLKRGLEGLSLDDRRCILDERCTTPVCEYGEYNISHGRCPRQTHNRNIFYNRLNK